MKFFTEYILIIQNILILFNIFTKCESMDSPTLLAECNNSCDACLNVFAQTSGDFSHCAIVNSRPIEICESCVEPYIYLKDSFAEILKQSDSKGKCSSQYLDLDRLQVIRSIYNYNDDLWNRAQCNSCFQFQNGSLTNNFTDDAIKFRKYYNKTTTCITTYKNLVSQDELCSICFDDYLKLNDFYHHIKRKNQDSICFDIVDLMNSTRKLWSADLNCCHIRQHPEVIFLLSSAGFALLPVIFYVLIKVLTKQDEAALTPQHRFAESFPSPSTSIIDR